MHEAPLFLFAGGLLAGSVLLALAAARASVPFLVVFLCLGMVLGADGLKQMAVEDAELVRLVGVAALAVILFEGGLSTSFRRLRTVAVPAALLSTIGVAITAIATGVVAHWIFDWRWLESLLLGAVVSSTDAAAVFATLRFTPLRRRLARTLEAESGVNDPMAIALTVGLVHWLSQPGYGFGDLSMLLVRQLGLGLAMGMLLGAVAMWAFARLPVAVGAFAPVASLAACTLAYGITDSVGGSGFMAVYLVGLAVGSTPSRYRSQLTVFHEGLAFLAQVVLFIILGVFVLPHDLLAVAGGSIVLAVLLVVLVRPLAVWVSTGLLPFTHRERALLGWAGLRGAVPIVLATIVLSSGSPSGHKIFNVVFFVVLISALLQGTTLNWVAKRLEVVDREVAEQHADAAKPIRTTFVVLPSHAIAGVMLKEIGLPPWARVAIVARGAKRMPLQGNTVLAVGDKITVVYPATHQPELDDVMIRWRRRL